MKERQTATDVVSRAAAALLFARAKAQVAVCPPTINQQPLLYWVLHTLRNFPFFSSDIFSLHWRLDSNFVFVCFVHCGAVWGVHSLLYQNWSVYLYFCGIGGKAPGYFIHFAIPPFSRATDLCSSRARRLNSVSRACHNGSVCSFVFRSGTELRSTAIRSAQE